jgi:hypothetical protein
MRLLFGLVSVMKQPKDHYVPEFYLRRWSENNPDQRLFSGRYFPETKRIEWTRHAPSGTGYERALYGEIEERFFKPLDNDACNILSRLESKHAITPIKLDLGEKDHDRWAEFIIGFRVRTPDKVELIREGFKSAGLPESVATSQIPKIVRNERVIKDLRALTWIFARVNTNLELITCDNPLIFKPNNLSHPDCVIALPLSPKLFFLATSKENVSRLEIDRRKMVININTEIVKNADKRIYAKSRYSVEESFVVKHWTAKGNI